MTPADPTDLHGKRPVRRHVIRQVSGKFRTRQGFGQPGENIGTGNGGIPINPSPVAIRTLGPIRWGNWWSRRNATMVPME